MSQCRCGRTTEQQHCIRCGSYWCTAYARQKGEKRKYRCRRCDERFYENEECNAPTFAIRPQEKMPQENVSSHDMYSNPASLEELFQKAEEKDSEKPSKV